MMPSFPSAVPASFDIQWPDYSAQQSTLQEKILQNA